MALLEGQVRLQDTAPPQHLVRDPADWDGQPERCHAEEEHGWYRLVRRDADGRQPGGQDGLDSAEPMGYLPVLP